MSVPVPDEDLLDSIALSGLGRGRATGGCELHYVRDLTQEDIELLLTSPAVPATPRPLQTLRAAHHQVARLVAEGQSDVVISSITGRTPASVWQLKQDPTFQQLVAYYSEQVGEQFLDAQKQIAALGMTAVEIIQERLEDPEIAKGIPTSVLMKIAESALDRSIAPNKGRTNGGTQPAGQIPSVAINVRFGSGQEASQGHSGPTIELKANE